MLSLYRNPRILDAELIAYVEYESNIMCNVQTEKNVALEIEAQGWAAALEEDEPALAGLLML